MPINDLSDTEAIDAGLRPASFYKAKMSPTRFRLRQKLLKYVERESKPLVRFQKALRCKALDYYFLYTANLGSHTFYVLCCPVPGWLGAWKLLRDSVTMLGLGIYTTGCVKDYLCLPRPRGVERLTLSKYTASEYGCPSSHTANATSVCLLIFRWVYQNWRDCSYLSNFLVVTGVLLYFWTLVVGRLYCGMHGFIDVGMGALIGTLTFVFRELVGPYWDNLVVATPSALVPLASALIFYAAIYFHPVPLEPCPCYEDSIAFVGVLVGLDAVMWFLPNYTEPVEGYHPAAVPYDSDMGIPLTLLRLLAGVAVVVTWKLLSKPALQKLTHSTAPTEPWAYTNRLSAPVINKMIVYAGIPTAVMLCKFVFPVLGLGPTGASSTP